MTCRTEFIISLDPHERALRNVDRHVDIAHLLQHQADTNGGKGRWLPWPINTFAIGKSGDRLLTQAGVPSDISETSWSSFEQI